jgi:hypothetical protein
VLPDSSNISTPDDLTAAIDKIMSTGRTPRSRTYSTQDASLPPRTPTESNSAPNTPRSRESRYNSNPTLPRSASITSKYSSYRSGDTLKERTNDALLYSRTASREAFSSRHGLDRLSEHSDHESLGSSDASAVSSPPTLYSPASYSPGLNGLKSPLLNAEMEKHLPGSSRGEVETHRACDGLGGSRSH